MKTPLLSLQHERVDDIPFLFGVVQQLRLPELLDPFLGTHHLHQGLSNGLLAATWITFILSEGNHCKVHVQDWVQRHLHTLETLWQQPVRPLDFSDDRLAIVLRRFHEGDWEAFERDTWHATCEVVQLPTEAYRLDATSSYGYHDTTDDGLMQYGHSKDHRPDLPQLKLMAAAAQPTCQTVACDVVPGNAADDVLYLPLIERVRAQVGQTGMLYVGDKKMAALSIRADLADHHDFYLTLLPRTGEQAALIDTWIDDAVTGKRALTSFTRFDPKTKTTVVFAEGYEFTRTCTCDSQGHSVAWEERVQLVRTAALHTHHGKQLERQLQEATEAVRRLTPPVGRGQQQCREAKTLREKIATILSAAEVEDLLQVSWERREYGQGKIRYALTAVERNEDAIAARKAEMGWRVQVTNLTEERCDLEGAIGIYNGGWSIERNWHLMKDRPLGIQPLFVREDDQIDGLTKLLIVALRVLTYMETVVRSKLAEEERTLSGLYPGQAKRVTARPTAVRMLRAMVGLEVTVLGQGVGEATQWSLAPLPPLLVALLELMGLSRTLYTHLASAPTDNTG